VAQPAVESVRTEWRFGGMVKLFILFFIIVGGIYSGLITATEAAAFGAFSAFVILIVSALRGGGRMMPQIFAALRDSASITSMVFAIIIGASIFSYFIVSAGVPGAFAEWVLGFDLPPRLLVLCLLLSLIPLGMFLDGVSILLITVPLFYPVVVTELGYDGLWYAVLTVKMIELGLITPPVGVNVFIVAGMVRGAELEKVFRSVTTFIVLDLVIFMVLFAFPGIVTWLPAHVR
jgi:TRAP-type C4-dicarboxylate transport system permease large subunit